MKRSEVLAPLSRDHHVGLVVAQRLKRAGDGDGATARERFLDFWEQDARRHFRIEEEILLPAFARHGRADDAAVVRVLTDHVEIRRLAAEVAGSEAASLELLHDLGHRLESHIRHEERALFPLVERSLPAQELEDLVGSILRAEREEAGDDVHGPVSHPGGHEPG